MKYHSLKNNWFISWINIFVFLNHMVFFAYFKYKHYYDWTWINVYLLVGGSFSNIARYHWPTRFIDSHVKRSTFAIPSFSRTVGKSRAPTTHRRSVATSETPTVPPVLLRRRCHRRSSLPSNRGSCARRHRSRRSILSSSTAFWPFAQHRRGSAAPTPGTLDI